MIKTNMRCALRTICFVFLLLNSYQTVAIEITAEGRGETESVARQQALSALSESLYVEIVSELSHVTNSSGDSHARKRIHSLSEIPVFGAKFKMSKSWEGGYLCKATLSSEMSGNVYQQKLSDLLHSINTDISAINRESIEPQLKYDLWLGLQSQVEQFTKLQNVASLLGVKASTKLPVSAQEIQINIDKLETEAETLSVAGAVLARKIDKHNIYVFPATFQNGHVITPLARLLRDYVSKNLHVANNYSDAKYYYKGNYEEDVKGLHVRYKLLDKEGNTLHTRTVKLSKAAYAGIKYQSNTQSFEQLLHQGYIVENDFRVNITTNHGREDLLFEQGQPVKILVKLNQPGYYYVVGHTLNDNGQLSYLLELMPTSGKRKFVRYINADDANKWTVLGEFSADPPFGVENLQVIASNLDLIDNLPTYKLNKTNGYYVIDTQSKTALKKVRSLKPTRNDSKNIKSSEAVLTLTTMIAQTSD